MISRRKAFGWAVFSLITGAALYIVGVNNPVGQQVEENILDASAFEAAPPAPLGLVSPFSIVLSFLAIAIVAMISHGYLRAIVISVYGAVAIVASQLLKNEWLERPDFLEQQANNTFPSGHMTVFAAIAAALIWAVPSASRTIASFIAAALMGTVAWQLLEYGWHRPSDVLAAMALVALIFSIGAWLGPRRTKHTVKPGSMAASTLNRILRMVLLVFGIVLTLGSILLLIIAASIDSNELTMNAGKLSGFGVSAIAAYIFDRVCP